MMPQTIAPPHLIDQMPAVRGRLSADAPIGQHTWFKTGGAAEVLKMVRT